MAGNTERDISLVIRARDESARTFEQVADALNKVMAEAADVGESASAAQQQVSKLAAILQAIQQVTDKTTANFDKASAAMDNMRTRVQSNTSEMENMKTQAESLASVIAALQAKQANGEGSSQVTASLASAKRDYQALQNQIEKTSAAIERDQQNMERAVASLQQLASTERAAKQAAQDAQDALTKQTTAIEAQRAAITELAAARQRADEQAAAAAEENQRRVNQNIAPILNQSQGETDFQTQSRRSAATSAFSDPNFDPEAANKEAAAIEELRNKLDPLASVTAKAAQEQAQLKEWFDSGKISADEYEKSVKLVEEAVGRATQSLSNKPKISLFGLQPYETQNLLYQINDVVTQLGSGTSLGQTLMQQGGQIFQLFQNRIGPSIKAAFSNPYFLTAAATLGTIAVAVDKAGDALENVRSITADLSTSQDGGLFDPEKLEHAAEGMEKYGISAKDAVAAVKEFAHAGLNPDYFESMAKTAQDMVDVFGGKLADAMKTVTTLATGNYSAIEKLDSKYNVFSETQLEHIKNLYEEGKATEAHTYALGIFTDTMDKAADKAKGGWSDAWDALKQITSSTMTYMANTTPIKDLAAEFDNLGESIAKAVKYLGGFRDASDIKNDIASITQQIEKLKNETDAVSNPYGANGAKLGDLQTQLAGYQKELGNVGGASGPTGGVNLQNTQAQQKADAKAQSDLLDPILDKQKQITNQMKLQQASQEAIDKLISSGKLDGVSDSMQQQIISATGAQAAQKMQAQIDKQAQQAIQQFTRSVMGAEGGPAQNPYSSATGYGQFTTDTWREQYRKTFPNQAQGQSNAQIDALRQNQPVAQAVVENFTKENAAALDKMGQEVNTANLYLSYMVGQTGAQKVLSNPNATVDKVGLSQAALDGNQGYLRNTDGSYKTGTQLQQFLGGRIASNDPAQNKGAQELVKLQQDAIKNQNDFNRTVDDENEKRESTIKSLTEENDLTKTGRLEAQRRLAIAEALDKLHQDAARRNANLRPGESAVAITPEQEQRTASDAGAAFDAQHASEKQADFRSDNYDEPVESLQKQQSALSELIQTYQKLGRTGDVGNLEKALDGTNEQLTKAATKMRDYYESILKGGPEAAKAIGLTTDAVAENIAKANTAIASAGKLKTEYLETGKSINEDFAGGLSQAVGSFATEVAGGENAVSALEDTFVQFAEQFLMQIAEMILKQIIFNSISGGDSGEGGGGIGGGIAGIASSVIGLLHTGGVVGESGGMTRAVNPGIFANAVRYHTGGIAGLNPNEIPTVLERDEEVLTRSDPRHVLNGGKSATGSGSSSTPGTTGIRQVLVFDQKDVAKAMAGSHGEKTVLTHLKNNAASVRQVLGVKG